MSAYPTHLKFSGVWAMRRGIRANLFIRYESSQILTEPNVALIADVFSYLFLTFSKLIKAEEISSIFHSLLRGRNRRDSHYAGAEE